MMEKVETQTNDILLNPECRDGKCRNCDGQGFDLQLDKYGPCPHHCHNPRPMVTISGKDGREWPI